MEPQARWNFPVSRPRICDATQYRYCLLGADFLASCAMGSYADQYFSLSPKERQVVTLACKAGDTALTRQLLLLHFPKTGPQEIPSLLKEIRGLAA